MRPVVKTLILISVGIALLPSVHGQVFVDHFAYSSGNLSSAGSSGGWTSSDNGVTVTSNGLDGTSLGLADPSGNKVTTTSNAGTGTYNQFSTGITTGRVYYSFLLRVNSTNGLSTSGQVISSLLRNGSASSYYQDVYLRLNGGNVEVGLAKLRTGTTWHSTPLTVGTTYLIVSKYEFVGGSNNDIVSLWVNPITGGTNEPTPNVTFDSGSDGNTGTGIGRCYIYGGYSGDLDEVRIGTTWASVTPFAAAPPPPNPVITQVLLDEEGFLMSGTNGPATGNYDVLASTDLALQSNQWTVIGADTFDGGGNFIFVDPVTPETSQKFYRIRVNDPNAPVGPTILVQPHDTTNAVGNTATFTVSATGTAPLSYQWYLDSTTPVTNGTGPTLTLNNTQLGDAGGYSVVITNVAGSITSVVAQLVVTNIVAPPSITTQPQSQSVLVGQTVNFNVVAAGTVPLSYQWYFDGVTPLVSETNALLQLPSVSTNDAGSYSVIVSNVYGTATSSNATLTVSTNAPPNFDPIGYCNDGGTITGGAAGPTVYVGSEAQLQQYSDVNPPYTIYITNSFNLSGMSTHIRSNKTVIGVGNVVLSGGGLYLYRASNVIIRNLTIQNSTEDNIGLHYSHHVWIDHCTIKNASDGGIDLTQESDFITISWCKFIYDANYGHNFVNLLGASDGEGSQGKLRTTFHHNWWSTNCIERLPSVRFGRAHIYNNYYNAPGNNYCARIRLYAEGLIQNNWFQNVKNPWEVYITSGTPGKIMATNNNIGYLDTSHGVSWAASGSSILVPGTNAVFAPPYSYTLDNAGDVPNIVIENAGAQKGPFAP